MVKGLRKNVAEKLPTRDYGPRRKRPPEVYGARDDDRRHCQQADNTYPTQRNHNVPQPTKIPGMLSNQCAVYTRPQAPLLFRVVTVGCPSLLRARTFTGLLAQVFSCSCFRMPC